MPKSFQLSIKSSLFGRENLLTIEPGFIEFGAKLNKHEIAAIRYGVRGIRGYNFYIGRIYCIDIQSNAGEVIKIRFRSFYKFRHKILYEQYGKIINALFENLINDISREYLKAFLEKRDFEILGVRFMQDGLMFNKKPDAMPWLDVSMKIHRTYFTIFSMSEPTKYIAFTYIHDWNAWVLYSILRHILRSKNLWKEQAG